MSNLNLVNCFIFQYQSLLYYYIYNAHGDVVALTDSSGNIKNSYSYDAWGNIQTADPFYDEYNVQRIMSAVSNLNNGKGVEHDLIEGG